MLTPGRFSFTCARCREDILPGQSYVFVKDRDADRRVRVHHRPDCAHAVSISALEEDLWSGHQRGYTIQMGGSIRQYDWLRGLAEGYAPRHVMIWSSQYRAREEYTCYCCPPRDPKFDYLDFIYPGEEYIREVWVGDCGWEVKRRHIDCPDEPWDPDEDENKGWEEDSGKEESKGEVDLPLKQAA